MNVKEDSSFASEAPEVGLADTVPKVSKAEWAFQLLKWMLPTGFAMLGFYIQSVCLHWATYCYVHKYVVDPDIKPDVNPYATLADPVEASLGEERINIHILDSIAGFFPALFFVLSARYALWINTPGQAGTHSKVLVLWTKVMMCAAFLFISKGIIGAVTTVPDSSGWQVCRERLKPEGVRYMKEEHSFLSMLILDFQWNVLWYHHPLRYCSDMMFSGHTFVVTLFALGLYELLRIIRPTQILRSALSLRKENKKPDTRKLLLLKMALLTGLALFAIVEQAIEIYAVEKSHFHYTSDIIVSLLMTFLFYTNGVIAISAKRWAGMHLNHARDFFQIEFKMFTDKITGDEWDIQEDIAESLEANGAVPNAPKVPKNWAALVSGGDIFIPPCCLPFCCLAGREHIYSDGQIKHILENLELKETPDDQEYSLPGAERARLQAYLKAKMNFNEGVSMHNFAQAVMGKKPPARTPQGNSQDSLTVPLVGDGSGSTAR